jgi:hypothetical protein
MKSAAEAASILSGPLELCGSRIVPVEGEA